MLARVLLAVHDFKLARRFEVILAGRDALVEMVEGSRGLREMVSRESFDLVFVSHEVNGGSTSEIVASLQTLPDAPGVVVLTDEENAELRAMLVATGCLAVLPTTLDDAVLRDALEVILRRRLQALDERFVPADTQKMPLLRDFVSASPAMQTFMHVVRRVVASDATLLIMGETGVGKERLARAIHAESPRGEGPFISVHCGALAESLLESELFGHEEGAFTGASRARRGWFELAHNGTIFLDEIGEMPKHLQVKLLNVLQTREVRRVGAETSVPIDVRVMAATNRDLAAESEAGVFRRDLYYRLSVVSLTIPPLSERREDIPALARRFVEHFRAEFHAGAEEISDAAMDALGRYDWPGNIRELMNVIERAMLLAPGNEITPADLPTAIRKVLPGSFALPSPESIDESLHIPREWLSLPLAESREKLLLEFERAYLDGLLKATRGRIGQTARRAGIRERSLYDKMKRLGLKKEDYR